ncbi:MAG: tyrosine/phenylalanine carboxypeptidase domain-containing protein [Chthoniobacterales bacterium]
MASERQAAEGIEVAEVAREVCERLAQGKPVRRTVPPVGSLFVDAEVPFLFVYRSPKERSDTGTKDLVTTEAAYFFAADDEEHAQSLQEFCRALATYLRGVRGAFLLVEVWSADLGGRSPGETSLPQAAFRITHDDALEAVASALQRQLRKIRFGGEKVPVALQVTAGPIAPPGLPALLEAGDGIFTLGIEVHPFWRSGDETYPALLRDFRAQFSAALRRGLFVFAKEKTKVPPRHFHEMGARALVKATSTFDRRLAEVSEAYDFLLQVTPINLDAAREQFIESGYERAPSFQYRPLMHQPEDLKRQLFEIPLEQLEDPTVAFLLGEKQAELDRQLTALRDIGTSQFLYTCLALYGAPDAALVELAEEVLARVPVPALTARSSICSVEEVRERALAHIAHYKSIEPAFDPQVEIRGDIASGMLVSRGALYLSEDARLSEQRLDALFQHEIGTHLVTHFNGDAQPFVQLRAGLANYEALQEGLAVLAEYLVGGLTPGRARTLAGRVLAVHWMAGGADFVEVFRKLTAEAGFRPGKAIGITMRIFRGGGFVKDQIYLQGFRDLIEYLAGGHALESLYVGKIALEHVPYIDELRHRQIIRAPRLLPECLSAPGCAERLEKVRQTTPLDLLTQPHEFI